MKKVNLTIAAFAVLSVAVIVTSCKKDEAPTADETAVSADQAFAENVYNNAGNVVDEAYNLATNTFKSGTDDTLFLGRCVTVTLDTASTPRELTIDFGDENCLCRDGKYRRGIIIVTFTGRYRHPGTVITTTFNNYYVNDNKVEGTRVVTNMGLNDSNHLYFTINVTGVIHRANNGGTLSWNAQKQREWIAGSDTHRLRDDVYLITGSSEGIRPDGSTWTCMIINPLRKALSCHWIVSGTVEIVPQNRPLRILDYGDGECDNIATVLINGVTYTITLR